MEADKVNEVEVVKSLSCKLTAAEIAAKWETFGKLTREQATLKNNAKSAAKEAKAAIERVEEQAWQTLNVAQSGIEYRDVSCIERIDIRRRVKETVRLDTHEIVYSTPVAADDLRAAQQQPLPGTGSAAPAAGEKPKRGKKGAKDAAATAAAGAPGDAPTSATGAQPTAAPDPHAPEPSYVVLPRAALEGLDRDSRQRLDAELVECGTGANAGVLVWQFSADRAVAGPINRHAIPHAMFELAEELRLAIGIVPAQDIDDERAATAAAEAAEGADEPPADDLPPDDAIDADHGDPPDDIDDTGGEASIDASTDAGEDAPVDNGLRVFVSWPNWNRVKPPVRRALLAKIEKAGLSNRFDGTDGPEHGLRVWGFADDDACNDLLEAMLAAGLAPIAHNETEIPEAEAAPVGDDGPPPDDVDEQPVAAAPPTSATPAPAIAAVPATSPASEMVRLVIPAAKWKRITNAIQRALIGTLNRLELYPKDSADGLATIAVGRNNAKLLSALDSARSLGVTLEPEPVSAAAAAMQQALSTPGAAPEPAATPAPKKRGSRKKKGDGAEDGA